MTRQWKAEKTLQFPSEPGRNIKVTDIVACLPEHPAIECGVGWRISEGRDMGHRYMPTLWGIHLSSLGPDHASDEAV